MSTAHGQNMALVSTQCLCNSFMQAIMQIIVQVWWEADTWQGRADLLHLGLARLSASRFLPSPL